MLFVYRYHDKVTGVYAPLSFTETDPKCFFKKLHATIITHPEQLINADLRSCEVQAIGVYDQETGTIVDLPDFVDVKEFDISADFDQVELLKRQINGNQEA